MPLHLKAGDGNLPLITEPALESESELALLPGMFAHMRNLFWWQKLYIATEWQWQDKTDNKNNNIQMYKIDNVQNSTNTICKIDNLVCTGMLGANQSGQCWYIS